jgi:uncharacterized damage-inducible protein DinB
MFEYLQILYDYNYWANVKILDTTEQISDEQFVGARQNGHGIVARLL